jgi:hypothetical protein
MRHVYAEGLVMRVRDSELESEVARAGLADLSRPLSGNMSELPEQQTTALVSALPLGPPILSYPMV